MAASLQDVREGFLCPICVKDLGSFHKLQNHFESTHSAEDKAVFEQVKGRLLTLYFLLSKLLPVNFRVLTFFQVFRKPQ